MPQRRSAKKALIQNKKKKQYNLLTKQKLKTALKALKKALESKDETASKKALSQVYKALDKSASKKTIHKNKAARKKSRLSKLVKKTSSK